MRAAAIFVFISLAALGCNPKKEGTPNGMSVVKWARGPTTWATGVSTGADVGSHTSFDKVVTFSPAESRHDKALGLARFKLHVERGDVALNAAPNGARPAEKAASPQLVQITVMDSGGWQISGSCASPLTYPGAGEKGAIVLAQVCEIKLSSGDDLGAVNVEVRGDGHVGIASSFGKAEAN